LLWFHHLKEEHPLISFIDTEQAFRERNFREIPLDALRGLSIGRPDSALDPLWLVLPGAPADGWGRMMEHPSVDGCYRDDLSSVDGVLSFGFNM
jgi:hypothetical protein